MKTLPLLSVALTAVLLSGCNASHPQPTAQLAAMEAVTEASMDAGSVRRFTDRSTGTLCYVYVGIGISCFKFIAPEPK